jgi:hypothetical protein
MLGIQGAKGAGHGEPAYGAPRGSRGREGVDYQLLLAAFPASARLERTSSARGPSEPGKAAARCLSSSRRVGKQRATPDSTVLQSTEKLWL